MSSRVVAETRNAALWRGFERHWRRFGNFENEPGCPTRPLPWTRWPIATARRFRGLALRGIDLSSPSARGGTAAERQDIRLTEVQGSLMRRTS